MMQDMRVRRRNPVASCLLSLLGVVVFLGVCYLICYAIFLAGNSGTGDTGTSGGFIILPYLFG